MQIKTKTITLLFIYKEKGFYDNTLEVATPTGSFAYKGWNGKAVPMVKDHGMKTYDEM
jgi:hypothetical protein